MKRCVLKIVVFLLAGAIINVAVAWGCAAWSPMQEFRALDRSPIPVPLMYRDFPRRVLPTESRGFGRRDIMVDHSGIDDQPALRAGLIANQKEAGWPMLCLGGQSEDVPRSSERRYRTSIESPDWLRHRDLYSDRAVTLIVDPDDFLPYGPIFPGFAINTIFYAAIVWMLFAVPGAVRRRVRIKRGQCAVCGYSLRDITSEKCPECGAIASGGSPQRGAGM